MLVGGASRLDIVSVSVPGCAEDHAPSAGDRRAAEAVARVGQDADGPGVASGGFMSGGAGGEGVIAGASTTAGSGGGVGVGRGGASTPMSRRVVNIAC